jgi:hypothetical protein
VNEDAGARRYRTPRKRKREEHAAGDQREEHRPPEPVPRARNRGSASSGSTSTCTSPSGRGPLRHQQAAPRAFPQVNWRRRNASPAPHRGQPPMQRMRRGPSSGKGPN